MRVITVMPLQAKEELKEHFEQDLAPWSYRILVKK